MCFVIMGKTGFKFCWLSYFFRTKYLPIRLGFVIFIYVKNRGNTGIVQLHEISVFISEFVAFFQQL